MPKEIRFCQPIGEYYFLSPLSAHPIKMVVDGQEYGFPTVEHYYQAMKFYAYDKRFETIIGLKNPDDARLLTKTPEYKINRRKDFDKIVFCNIGNPQAVGQKPLTFIRQVLSLLEYPDLLNNPNIDSLYP